MQVKFKEVEMDESLELEDGEVEAGELEVEELEVQETTVAMTAELWDKFEIGLYIEKRMLDHKKERNEWEIKAMEVKKEIERLERETAEQAKQLETGRTLLDGTIVEASENIRKITELIREFHSSHGWAERPPIVNEICNPSGDLLATYAKCLECEMRIQIQGLKINGVPTFGPDISYYKMHVNGIHFPVKVEEDEATECRANPEQEQAREILTGTQTQLETVAGASENQRSVSEFVSEFHRTRGWLGRPIVINEAFNMDGDLQETFAVCPECKVLIKIQGLKINGVPTLGPDISYYKLHVSGSHFPEVKEDVGPLLEI